MGRGELSKGVVWASLLAMGFFASDLRAASPSTGAAAQRAGPRATARSVMAATPPSASDLLYQTRMADSLELAIDVLEQTFGAEDAQDFLEGSPLPYLALETLSAGPEGKHGLDPQGGLGLFRHPEFNGAVGLVAARDELAAVRAVRDHLAKMGASFTEAKGWTRAELPEGPRVAFFAHRGFVYLALPELDVEDEPGLASSQEGFERLVALVRSSPEGGLEATAGFKALAPRVAPGDVYLFVNDPFEVGALEVRALLSARLTKERLKFDGFIETRSKLLSGAAPSQLSLLSRVPPEPTILASVSVDPEELARLLSRPVGEGSGSSIGEELLGTGASSLLAAFGGQVQAVLHVDPTLVLKELERGGEVLGPLGTVQLESSLRDAKEMRGYLGRWLSSVGQKVTRSELGKGKTRLRAMVQGQPVELRVEPDQLTLRAGPPWRSRERFDAVVDARESLGSGAFGPRHVTGVLDVRRFVERLEAVSVDQSPGQGMSRALLIRLFQATRVDRVGVDFGPEEGGVRFTGEVRYRKSTWGRTDP